MITVNTKESDVIKDGLLSVFNKQLQKYQGLSGGHRSAEGELCDRGAAGGGTLSLCV